MSTAKKHAKRVLEIMSYELRSLPSGDLKNLEIAVESHIEEALRDQMRTLNQMDRDRARGEVSAQGDLLKVRKRKKKEH